MILWVNAGVNTTPPSEYFFCFRCFPILDAISDPRNPDYPHTTPAKGRGFHRRRARTLSDEEDEVLHFSYHQPRVTRVAVTVRAICTIRKVCKSQLISNTTCESN